MTNDSSDLQDLKERNDPRKPPAEEFVLQTGAPLKEATLAVVLLHGRGASSAEILPLGSSFHLPSVAYLAPQAAGNSWYPLSFLAPRAANEPYLSSALAQVESVVNSLEHAGFSRNRIVLAGFSQGACLAAEFVASHPARYAGLLAFTGGLIGSPGSLPPRLHLPVATPLGGMSALLCSGDPDPHVPWTRVEETAAIFTSMGAMVTMKRYPGRAHTIAPEELGLARDLLVEIQGSRPS